MPNQVDKTETYRGYYNKLYEIRKINMTKKASKEWSSEELDDLIFDISNTIYAKIDEALELIDIHDDLAMKNLLSIKGLQESMVESLKKHPGLLSMETRFSQCDSALNLLDWLVSHNFTKNCDLYRKYLMRRYE